MDRRKFLIGAGALGVLVLGAGAVVSTRDIDQARQPWRFAAGDFEDPRMHALAQAILAPNPHNRQPWLIELEGSDRLRLLPDLDRMLPETDPPNRQITIGFGAFLELLRQAASVTGHQLVIDRFPRGSDAASLDPRPIAEVIFEPAGILADPLAGTILNRRTTRAPFDKQRPVPSEVMGRIAQRAAAGDGFSFTSEPKQVKGLTALNRKGWEAEFGTEATHAESTRLTRIGASEVNANPDGISLYGPAPEIAGATGLISRSSMKEEGSFAAGQVLNFYLDVLDATATYAWLVTPGNSRQEQLDAGAHWVRINQAATAEGVAFHPVSQVLQEFDAMAVHLAEVHRMLAVEEPARIQGLFRLGYAPFPEPAPRWPLASRITAA